jgi:hypothetical protein
MATLTDDLRREIESTVLQAYKDWKTNAISTAPRGNVEGAASYALSEIIKNLRGTGLKDDAKKPWSNLTTSDLDELVTRWCLERQLTALEEQDKGK